MTEAQVCIDIDIDHIIDLKTSAGKESLNQKQEGDLAISIDQLAEGKLNAATGSTTTEVGEYCEPNKHQSKGQGSQLVELEPTPAPSVLEITCMMSAEEDFDHGQAKDKEEKDDETTIGESFEEDDETVAVIPEETISTTEASYSRSLTLQVMDLLLGFLVFFVPVAVVTASIVFPFLWAAKHAKTYWRLYIYLCLVHYIPLLNYH